MPSFTCTHAPKSSGGPNFVHTHTADNACALGSEDSSCPAGQVLLSCAQVAPPPPPAKGLSTGAKIAIAVGIVVVTIIIARLFSDARLKRDIALLRRLPNGIGIYSFRYLWSDTRYVGVIAQEVADIVPDAVRRSIAGYLTVDYERLGLRMMRWEEWVAEARVVEEEAA
ncbi:MAG: tail fiber domain-containing protein [Gemmatimonadaceae bacterium]